MKMYLELHDNEEGNTLFARINNLDYAYQAEQWVQETSVDNGHEVVIKWILFDRLGPVCVWERSVGSTEMPSITQRAERFTGTWEKGPKEVVLPIPTEEVTLHMRTKPYQGKDEEGYNYEGVRIIGEVKRGKAVLYTETVIADDNIESVCDTKESVAIKIELWAVENTNFMPTADALPA